MTYRRLVLDDERIMLDIDGWETTHVRTADEAIELLRDGGRWDEVWLDHDLFDNENGTGYDVVCLIENGTLCPDVGRYVVHTMNPVGGLRMMEALTRCGAERVRLLGVLDHCDIPKMIKRGRAIQGAYVTYELPT